MAAEAIVSVVVEQLTGSVIEEIRKAVGLVAGAGEAVEILASNFRSIQAVLMDAEERQVNNNAVKVWLDKLKEAAYDVDDALDEWNTKSLKLEAEGIGNASTFKKKVRLFFLSPGYCFGLGNLRREIALKIKEINRRLDVIAREKDAYSLNMVRSMGSIQKTHDPAITPSFVDVSDIYGREEEKHTLMSKLLSKSNEEGKRPHIISIVGMGGMGKTTLAQLAYNDPKIDSSFKKRIWVCVSEPFDQFRIAKAILEALTGDASQLSEFQALLEHISTSIERKKFLLVLDDVWTEDYKKWESLCNCLKNGHPESKILVTTRKETVARMMESIDIIAVKELSGDKCWSLFQRLAFFGRPTEECKNLEEIGKKIVGKCKGLPLAIKTIGSLLRFKKHEVEWQSILNSELWNLKEFKKDIFPALLLSYNDLPYMIRRCFSYCAIFLKDYNMKKDQLIQLWMAQGYLGFDQNDEMEKIGEEYFNDLAARSFFQDFEKDDYDNIIGCKMHDIIHDFAQSLTKNECFAIEVYDSQEPIGTSTSYAKAHHSMLRVGRGASFSLSMLETKMLRSLLIDRNDCNFSLSVNVQDKLFDELTCLRVLSLIEDPWRWRFGTRVERISRKIGKLIHLRYLNLSDCRGMVELPETLCELYNLQVLDITWCRRLKKLPQGMGKLINLRHLLNEGNLDLLLMPKGMKRLTCLRTLKIFVVCDGNQGSTLDCLKNLNTLRGSLSIKYLGNVLNVAEVKKEKVLRDKKYLTDLTLDFKSADRDEENIGILNERQEDVLESLQPTSNLEKLWLERYRGNTLFPNWNLTSLTKLRELTIRGCDNCDRLPPLGKLSSLELLYIDSMSNVKSVSNEFLGMEIDTTSSSSVVAFPKLKSLSFTWMFNWEEWDYKITKMKKEAEDDSDFPMIMPCLRSLEIRICPQLNQLPDHLFKITTLQELTISDSWILSKRCSKEEEDYWKKMEHITNIQIDGRYVKTNGVEPSL